ncbi:hypothetical protein L873DRAFT_1801321 [Choiromyces venosus 120613-1]|uniref:Uncharacterized protein n=1 Tax=Choiromyces venosus 120613-1 TaxID=1336337 RepID=A0A3N4K1W7_9PEZI|nr:hypothetical protein L873DRAFT_1801321 [Choiromyces venosus 120613-1]
MPNSHNISHFHLRSISHDLFENIPSSHPSIQRPEQKVQVIKQAIKITSARPDGSTFYGEIYVC